MKYKLNICALKNVVDKNLQNTNIVKYLHEYMKTEEDDVTSELMGQVVIEICVIKGSM